MLDGHAQPEAATSTDGDEFMLSVPGASGSLVRTGRGSGPSEVIVRSVGPAQLARLQLRFPMVGTAHPTGDHLVVCHILGAPPGARWDGTDLAAGQTFVYPPGSIQVAADPEGLDFVMGVVAWNDLEAAAAAMGFDPEPAAHAQVCPPSSGATMRPLRSALGSSGATAVGSVAYDDVLDAAVRASCIRTDAATGGRRRWSSEDIVQDVDAFLTSTGTWRAPILTLCRHANVSERRLHTAFQDAYGTTPHAYLKHRALQAAHRHLDSAERDDLTVQDIARTYGFVHLGRFASLHHEVFGMRPSDTLARPARSI